MLFGNGDWVWFAWKHGVELLPVGSGHPCIPITPRWTVGPGLLITEEGLDHKGPSTYSTLALATTDNHICVDYKGNEYIYLASFKEEDLWKRFGYHNQSIIEMIKDATILQLNPDFDHYGYHTKRNIDRDTIHFIKRWLEEKPMKASNNMRLIELRSNVETDATREYVLCTNIQNEELKDITIHNTLFHNYVDVNKPWNLTHDIITIDKTEYKVVSGNLEYTEERYNAFGNHGEKDPILVLDFIETHPVAVHKTPIDGGKLEKLFVWRCTGKSLDIILTYLSKKHPRFNFVSPASIKRPHKVKKPTPVSGGTHAERLALHNASRSYMHLPRKEKKKKKKKDRDETLIKKRRDAKRKLLLELYESRLAGTDKTKIDRVPRKRKPKAKIIPWDERSNPTFPVKEAKTVLSGINSVKPKRVLSKHQSHLERAYFKKLKAANLANLEKIRKQVHNKQTGPIKWYDPGKHLPSEHYNKPKVDTTVLTACERKYLHYLNLAQGLEMRCRGALNELNRYKALVVKYRASKSEKQHKKADGIEKNAVPNLVFNYRRYTELFNEAARLREKWHDKVEVMLNKAYEPKNKKSTKPDEVVHPVFKKYKHSKHPVMVCMKNNETGDIVRITKEIGDTLHTKNPKQFTYTGKEEWKAWKKKQRKGEYKSGVQKPGYGFAQSKFERIGKKKTARAMQQHKQSQNVHGAMPRTKTQIVTTKVPEQSKSGRSSEAYHVYAQDAVQFTFKSNHRTIVKGEDGKLFFKNLNPIVQEFRVGKRVLLEVRELNYNYTKPASTVTKTIIHHSTYTDSTSMTTSGKSLRRHRR